MVTLAQPRTDRFPSPFDIETPRGAEGWRDMYPPYLLFSEENREFEDNVFWMWDGMHLPEVQLPFETHTHEGWIYACSVVNSRIFAVPPSFGFTQRMLNGYEYVALSPVTDPKEIEARVPVFMARAGHYYQNWNDLFEQWKQKAETLIKDMAALEVLERLPDIESDAFFHAHPGGNSGQFLLQAYDTLLQMDQTAWTYHFEMLNIGYAAYLNLFLFCRQAFPGITDQTMAHMLSGTETMYMRPDAELRKLSRLAVDLGVADRMSPQPQQTLDALRADRKGREWVAAFESVREPWFNLSTGNGLYHHHASWNDDLRVPFKAMAGYVARLDRGESIDRPVAHINERKERITAEYRALLQSDEDRQAFDQNLGLARTVATFIEDHAFIIHDWYHSVEWNKVREFGRFLVNAHVLGAVNDLFYLNRWEVPQALFEAVSAWASVTPSRGGNGYWMQRVEQRKGIVEALRQWTPPPALGPAPTPEEANDPIMLMLYGLTPDRIQSWLGVGDANPNELRGVAASAGTATGTARVVRSVNELSQVQDGEILVCPMTEPAWSPIFSSIKGAVSDIGGIMSHSAIISREYGMPAVVGTGTGTSRIKTGDTITVDGTNGVVTIHV